MTKHLLALLVLTLAAPLVASCASSSEAPVGIYGNPPTLEDYVGTLPEGYMEESAPFFFQGMTPPDDRAYRALARNYRETGLEALSNEDREALLLVAQIAFLSYADTLRYSVTVATDGTGTRDDHDTDAVVEEVYSGDREQFLAARRLIGTAMSWPWPVWARRDEGSPAESRQFFGTPVNDPDGSWFVPETLWNKDDDRWSCLKMRIDDFTWAAGNYAFLENFRAFGVGALLERDTVGERSAYRFTGTGAEQRHITYWLDAETLWLRQYEYEDDGIHYTVKLKAVNEDIRIEPPDVDVECVEEEAQ